MTGTQVANQIRRLRFERCHFYRMFRINLDDHLECAQRKGQHQKI